MNKYKVEFTRTETYVIDVLAKTEEEARAKARTGLDNVFANGTYHYHESKDPETEVSMVYDVTNTDDPFSPMEGGQV